MNVFLLLLHFYTIKLILTQLLRRFPSAVLNKPSPQPPVILSEVLSVGACLRLLSPPAAPPPHPWLTLSLIPPWTPSRDASCSKTSLCILVDDNDCVVGHDTKYNCDLVKLVVKENYEEVENKFLQWQDFLEVFRDPSDFAGVKNAAQRKLLDELGIPSERCPS
ncbi:hypothetical protein ACH5RR_016154 [Cinchona calisaya]|uniref:Uncharacterized protein n=1 Tax=Cinchona calisaya TaxID=153742 RepID=A0ABD2ZYK1_9GENT